MDGSSPEENEVVMAEQNGDQAMPTNKAELMERIDRSWAALEQVIARADEAELTRPGGADGWSVKDHLVHLATWERSLLALLEGSPRHEAVGLDKATYEALGTDGVNAAVYERNKDLPLAEALAFVRQTHESVLRVLAAMTDADLLRPYSHYQPDEPPHNPDPVVYWINGNTFGHYEEHTGWIEALLASQNQP
jgi:hypothetical protein